MLEIEDNPLFIRLTRLKISFIINIIFLCNKTIPVIQNFNGKTIDEFTPLN